MNRYIRITGAAFLMASGALVASMSQASTLGCAEGDRQLPISGLCEHAAESLVPIVTPRFDEAAKAFGCTAQINETRFLDGVMLYWAAECNGKLADLELRISGTYADLYVGASHLRDGDRPDKAGEYFGELTNSPAQYAANAAQTQMAHFSDVTYSEDQIAKCTTRKEPMYGPNAYVVDEYAADALPTGDASMRDACGTYGFSADSGQYWVLGENDAWFFAGRFQDWLQDFDRKSLTFVSQNEAGEWVENNAPGEAMAAALVISDDYSVTNIAEADGAQETPYDTARGYQVFAGSVNGVFKYCVAEQDFSGSKLRIGFDGGQWQVAVAYAAKPDYYGSYEIDGRGRGMSGTASANWTFWWLGQPELDQIREGNMLVMDIRRASLDFPLSGSWSAITKVDECVQRRGQNPNEY